MPKYTGPPALTQVGEDEALFRKTVPALCRRPDRSTRPRDGRGAADECRVDPQTLRAGPDGHRDSEEYGGSAGTFFEAILAVEEISAVDPSVGVLVDVQNTLCINALIRWASAEQKSRYLPKLATGTIGAYALSEAASGSDAFALQTRAHAAR